MELHLISHPQFFEDEAQLVQVLMNEHGLIFHLRKPDADIIYFDEFLKEIPSQYHCRIMLHGAYDLICKYDVMGLHFSGKKRSQKGTFHCGFTSTSCHSINELEQLDGKYNQLFISPVFPSISKPGYRADFSLDELKNFCSRPRKSKIIALGGLDKETIPLIESIGLDGIAVLGAVWGDDTGNGEKIKNNLKHIIECMQ